MEFQICATCKINKSIKLFKIRKNKIYKSCIDCYDKFKCDKCEYKYSTKGNLQTHIKLVHNKIKNFECTLCKFKCSLNSNLKRHIKIVHDKIKDINCNLCQFKCSSNGHLQTHIKSVHNKIKNIKCEICDYTCSQNSSLQTHIKAVHNKIKNFECTLCKFKCSSNGSLKTHIKLVHDKIKDFECTLCQFKCSTNSNLQRHIFICKGNDHSNMSGLELRTKEALITLGFDETDFIFNSSYSKLTDFCGRPLRPDFRFIHHKIMIECDGIQHSIPQAFFGYKEEAEDNFKKIQESDNIKNEFCEKYGYKMIRVKYNEKNVLQLLHTELIDYINF